MSSVNYSLKHKGVRLIDSQEAWVRTKKGGLKLNPKYTFVGKIDSRIPNLIITASDKTKPRFKGNTYDLNRMAKEQIVDHFYDERGKRNRKTVAYFGIPKPGKKAHRKGEKIREVKQ